MLRIAICDDDADFLDRFEVLIHKCIEPYNREYTISKFTNGISMIAAHREAGFDVVFLDIDMPHESGIEVVREFRRSDSSVYIIFVTNHTKYVYDSFDVQPFHFIVKSSPKMLENKLLSVIKLLFNHIKQNQTTLLEDARYGCISVAYREIRYIESRAHYCVFHINSRKTDNTSYKVRKNISELEKELEYFEFARIHKKYIVNLSQVASIDKTNRYINLKDGTALSLGPTYKSDVEGKFMDYLRKH